MDEVDNVREIFLSLFIEKNHYQYVNQLDMVQTQ